MRFSFFIVLLSFLYGCSQKESTPLTWQEFQNRDRIPLYRAKVPSSWVRKDPPPEESLTDTKKPISEFSIEEGAIRVTIHTFPYYSKETRIPSLAQIQRWKGQFEELDPLMTSVTRESHGGFIGLFLEAEGLIQGQQMIMMGWSMQLAPEYERKLQASLNPLDQKKRADYTIKALGPLDLMIKYRKGLMNFANSFELIDPLPTP